MRSDHRQPDQIRRTTIERGYTQSAPGSVLIQCGRTTVLCTASVDPRVPAWMAGRGRGWITAEYSMLPGSTRPRKRRERGPLVDGRSSEIQRLVGRSLRAVADLALLGEQTITIDCDVLEADGGTRTAGITGALVALVDALESIRGGLPDPTRYPLRESIAAVSAGIVAGEVLLDLDHGEDSAASVDMNVVMAGNDRFVEVQGTGEEATFTEDELTAMVRLARAGIRQLTDLQREALGDTWPFA
ncbi:MAG TPA: ribonuclease PH [Thermoguttaceae bacterium]|nr:ribonuclease PH [Thermoguttaceae bacterium]